ncbi:MAG: hypothetical protein ABI416_04320, partial [Ginsengibacter sp.]
ELKKNLDSKEYRESMQKMKDTNMDEFKKAMDKVKTDTEKSREQLKKDLQKMKEALETRNATMINYGYGSDKNGFAWI